MNDLMNRFSEKSFMALVVLAMAYSLVGECFA